MRGSKFDKDINRIKPCVLCKGSWYCFHSLCKCDYCQLFSSRILLREVPQTLCQGSLRRTAASDNLSNLYRRSDSAQCVFHCALNFLYDMLCPAPYQDGNSLWILALPYEYHLLSGDFLLLYNAASSKVLLAHVIQICHDLCACCLCKLLHVRFLNSPCSKYLVLCQVMLCNIINPFLA